jgi:hypothetical protein
MVSSVIRALTGMASSGGRNSRLDRNLPEVRDPNEEVTGTLGLEDVEAEGLMPRFHLLDNPR